MTTPKAFVEVRLTPYQDKAYIAFIQKATVIPSKIIRNAVASLPMMVIEFPQNGKHTASRKT